MRLARTQAVYMTEPTARREAPAICSGEITPVGLMPVSTPGASGVGMLSQEAVSATTSNHVADQKTHMPTEGKLACLKPKPLAMPRASIVFPEWKNQIPTKFDHGTPTPVRLPHTRSARRTRQDLTRRARVRERSMMAPAGARIASDEPRERLHVEEDSSHKFEHAAQQRPSADADQREEVADLPV
jgi:hypothetical protein